MLPDLLQVVQRTDDGATVLDGSLVGAHGGVPTRIAQGLGAGGLIRGDERVQIVGVLEAEQPALGERLSMASEALSVEPDSAAGLEARAAIRCRYGSKSNARNPMAATQPGERDRNSSAS